TVHTLKERNKVLEEKIVDMEMRSRLNNLRLAGLITRVPRARTPVRFWKVGYQSYKHDYDKHAIKAAIAKKDVLYKNQHVRFYNDLTTEVHKQRRQYNSVHQQLRSLGLRHGFIPPAKLV
ncbi:hypothetical protein L3Q82_013767, partial [Scortum barcoo]